MADMGFLPSVKRILDVTAPSRQVLLFSATLGPEIEALVRQYLRDPARHDVTPAEESSDVSHLFWHAEREDRVGLTARLVSEHGRALVFCRTRHGADRLAKQLKFAGVEAMAIHGDRTQAQRERALAAFSRGSTQVLVATDVAARGITWTTCRASSTSTRPQMPPTISTARVAPVAPARPAPSCRS